MEKYLFATILSPSALKLKQKYRIEEHKNHGKYITEASCGPTSW